MQTAGGGKLTDRGGIAGVREALTEALEAGEASVAQRRLERARASVAR